jgi:hypothetical protein
MPVVLRGAETVPDVIPNIPGHVFISRSALPMARFSHRSEGHRWAGP